MRSMFLTCRLKKEKLNLFTLLSFLCSLVLVWMASKVPSHRHATQYSLIYFRFRPFFFCSFSLGVASACATRLVPLSQEKDEDYHRHHSQTHAHTYTNSCRQTDTLGLGVSPLPVFVLIQNFLSHLHLNPTSTSHL
jgi:hypothetical protein